MKVNISNNLIKLINYVHAQTGKYIYVVGGYVRNSLMGLKTTDIDLCGEILAEDLMSLLSQIGFTSHTINKTLGTILIHAEHERYEYTTFRKESYAGTGEHLPNSVAFTNSLQEDALRRDFTVNAIYYNHVENKIIDPFNGINDIKQKVIKTVQDPNKTFSDDALRVLRLLRFVNELNFKWHKNTFKSAIKNSYKMKNLSRERIVSEVKLIINADTKYYNLQQQKQAVKMFNRFNVYKYLFNNNFNNLKITPKTKTYNAFIKSNYSTRFVAFIVLCMQAHLKGKTTPANIVHLTNTMLGADGLRKSKKNIQFITNIYVFVQLLLYDSNSLNDSLLLNHATIEFMNFNEHIKTYLSNINQTAANKILKNHNTMQQNNLPFSTNDLNITSQELMQLGIAQNQISSVLKTLLNECLVGNVGNTNKKLKVFVKNQLIVKTAH